MTRGMKFKLIMLEWKLNNPCVDCGLVSVTNEFDHVKGTKEFNISNAFMRRTMTTEKFIAEIEKCVMRCAKCHRIKTHRDNDSWLVPFIDSEENGIIDQFLIEMHRLVEGK